MIMLRFSGCLFGQQPDKHLVSNRIIRHVRFGQQPSIVRQIFAVDEAFHGRLEVH